MVGARRSWDGRRVRVASLAGILALALPIASAPGSSSVVSATVAPMVGVAIDASGTVSMGGSTMDVSITRERRGDQLVVTVMPNG